MQKHYVFHTKTRTYFHIDFNNDHFYCCRKGIKIIIDYYIGLDHIHPVSSHFLDKFCDIDFIFYFSSFEKYIYCYVCTCSANPSAGYNNKQISYLGPCKHVQYDHINCMLILIYHHHII